MKRASLCLTARLAAVLCASSALLAACDSSESSSSTTKPGSDASTTQDTATGGTDATSAGTDASTGTDTTSAGTDTTTGSDTTSGAFEQSGSFDVTADITKDTVWKTGAVATLTSHIHIVGATLTIEPGVTILGKQGSSLVSTKTGKLVAAGTKAQPIVFTSAKAAGSRAPGDWGGLVLLGQAPINVDGGSEKIEGYQASDLTVYGGSNPDHNCGTLQYVRVEFAGFELAKDNELNGITLGGCGAATKVDYIQSHKGNDDGVEVFGGTVNLKHVIVSQTDDDGLDWDYGWTGKAQFVVIQQNNLTGDMGIEADSNKNNMDATPRSNPTIWNLSLIGSDAEPGLAGKTQSAALFRRGTAGNIGNAVVAHFADFAINIADSATVKQCEAGAMTVHDSLFFDNGNSDWPADDTKKDDDGGFDDKGFFYKSDWKNTFGTDPMLTDATSTAAPNFLPKAGSPALTGGATPPSDAFFDATATFRGAFGATNWAEGWAAFPAN